MLELRPRPGDLPASGASGLIPRADILAITGTAIVNHTLEPLLSYRQPNALVILIGPTAPLSPILFNYGIDFISGSRVINSDLVLGQVAAGAGFRQLKGIRVLTMRRRSI